jgi:porin
MSKSTARALSKVLLRDPREWRFFLAACCLTASATPSQAVIQPHAVPHKTRRQAQAELRKSALRHAEVPAAAAPRKVAVTELKLARLDAAYAIKMWDFRSPSQADTLLGDGDGLRTTLDRYGLGFIEYNITQLTDNTLATPLKVPQAYAPSINRGTVAAGNQVYNGERPTFANISLLYAIDDTSRLGIPDGQIIVGASKLNSTWQPFLPNQFSLQQLTYYQTLFEKKLEVEVGLLSNTSNFVGTNIGGTFATTFGPAAAVHVLLGMSFVQTPAVVLKYHVAENIYSEASVQRSDPVHGPTGNPIFDGAKQNPAGVRFSAPGDGVFLVDEVGYRREAAPGVPETWIRAAGMYNNARFTDYSRVALDAGATVEGNEGVYVLADRQILQTAPGSALTAYRGLYVGGTFEYAPQRTTPISQYEEARLYSVGPFDKRPTDLVSFVYNHQVFSHYIADALNPVSAAAAQFGVAIPMAVRASNAYTVSYLAHIAPGAYVSGGLGYTDHPSAITFKGEGHALTALLGLLTVF